ncbi:MAG: class I tRNA ligase family protein, partial [Trebonia sp.]
FWVIRMMLFGLYAMEGEVPFRTVLLHGLVRDQYGAKMSKSRGNVIDPLVWIDQYGADAVRFALLQGANPGADVVASEEWVLGARHFANKLWNATRFALLNGASTEGPLPDKPPGTADAWILSRLQAVIAEVDALYERYDLGKIADVLYHFAWDEVCDWYLELAKIELAGPSGDETRRVLGEVLDHLLRLLHPMVPFVTDTLWRALTAQQSVVIARWPAADASRDDPAATARIAAVQAVITEVRRFRSEQGVKPAQRVPARVTGAGAGEAAIRALLRLDEPGNAFAPTASVSTSTGVRVELDLSGAIDVAAERARLTKALLAAGNERDKNQAKLGNQGFLDKAPAAVVVKHRDRLAGAEAELTRILAALDALPPT